MMKVLLLSQAIAQNELEEIVQAFPPKTMFTFLTGSPVSYERVDIYKTTPHDSRSLKSRLKCWLGYIRDVMKWYSRNQEHFDFIYGISNPPVDAWLGCWLKRRLKAPFVYMNWDLYPQIIEKSYSNPVVRLICSLWHAINRRIYPQIDQMITIGSVMRDSINAPMKKKLNIDIVPIACNTDKLLPRDKASNPFIMQNGLTGKFIVLYSGKLGYGHNISAFLKAAEMLRNEAEIEFVFIGKGPRCAEVEKAIKDGASNVKLFPYQSEELFPYSMACGDVGIVSQEERLAHLFLPSKTYSMMACGMPVIGLCSNKDDLKELLEESGAGYAITDGNAAKLAEYVLKLYKDRELQQQLSLKARIYIEENYSEEAVIDKYRNVFDKVISGSAKK